MTEPTQYPDIGSLIEQARPLLFDFNYPIWSDNYRATLETKIIEYYLFREICCTPVARWKLYLNREMSNIMPYWNQVYVSTTWKYDPLWDSDFQKTHARKTNVEGTQKQDTTDKNVKDFTDNATLHTDTKDDIHSDRDIDNTLTKNGTLDRTTSSNTDYTGETKTDSTIDVTSSGESNGNTSGTNDTTQTLQHGATVTDTMQHGHTTKDTLQHGLKQTGTDTTSQSGHSYFSDTPQSQIPINDIGDKMYLTNATLTGGTSNKNTTNQNSGTDTRDVTNSGTDTHNIRNGGTDTTTTDNDTTGTSHTTESSTSKTVGETTGKDTQKTTSSGTQNDTTTEKETGHTDDTYTEGKTGSIDTKTSDTNQTTINDTFNLTGEHTQDTLDNIAEHIFGKTGGHTYPELIQSYRDAIVNIDYEIIKMLSKLFFLLY